MSLYAPDKASLCCRSLGRVADAMGRADVRAEARTQHTLGVGPLELPTSLDVSVGPKRPGTLDSIE